MLVSLLLIARKWIDVDQDDWWRNPHGLI